jgi:hypothetical protein
MKIGHKGSVYSAEVVYYPMHVYGVSTNWAVTLHIQSPTGDSSDFLQYSIPCVSKEQACSIADNYNEICAPYLLGVFEQLHSDRPMISVGDTDYDQPRT